jgi:hypothetical protein
LKLAHSIRHYRNVLTHNPKLGNLVQANGIFLVPKETELYRYPLWSQIAHRLNNEYFIKLLDLITYYNYELNKKTNTIWEYFIDYMNNLSKTEDYKRLLQVSELKIPGIVDLLKSSSTNIISGSSYDPTKDNFR